MTVDFYMTYNILAYTEEGREDSIIVVSVKKFSLSMNLFDT